MASGRAGGGGGGQAAVAGREVAAASTLFGLKSGGRVRVAGCVRLDRVR
jgi:hypothetical protein